MTASFPDDHELVGFFEVEPKVLDPGVPWLYNTLVFETERQGILVRCRLSPAYGDISVRLEVVGGGEIARIEVRDYLVVNAQGEALIATSDQASGMLCLMLNPRVWVGLGNFDQIPPEA